MYQCVVETSLLAFDSRPRTSQPPALLPTSPFPLCRLDKCLGKQCRQKCRQSSYLPFPPLDTILGGCEKRVENTFSLLASFFIFLLLFGQLCLRFVGVRVEEGGGQILNGFFTFRLIAPPTQPDKDSSGQLSTVIRVAFFRLFKY